MLRDDDIRKVGFASGLLRLKGNTITRWKDGIDIDYPVLEVEKFARAVEQATYAAAIKACEDEQVDAESSGSHLDVIYNNAVKDCADAIRSLMQEQPK